MKPDGARPKRESRRVALKTGNNTPRFDINIHGIHHRQWDNILTWMIHWTLVADTKHLPPTARARCNPMTRRLDYDGRAVSAMLISPLVEGLKNGRDHFGIIWTTARRQVSTHTWDFNYTNGRVHSLAQVGQVGRRARAQMIMRARTTCDVGRLLKSDLVPPMSLSCLAMILII